MTTTELRIQALGFAITISNSDPNIIKRADEFLEWLGRDQTPTVNKVTAADIAPTRRR